MGCGDVGIPSPAKAVLLLSPSQSPFLWDSLVELKNPLGIPLACEIPAELCVLLTENDLPNLPKGSSQISQKNFPKSRVLELLRMEGDLFPRKAGCCCLQKILPFTRLDLARAILSALNYSSLFPCCSSTQFQALICHDFLSFWGYCYFPPSSKLTPSWRCSSAFLGFFFFFKSASPASLTPFPMGISPGKALGMGKAGLDPAGAPDFGSTSQPAWPWNAGEASRSVRKKHPGNSSETMGLSF